MNIEDDLNNNEKFTLPDSKVMKLTLIFKMIIAVYKAVREIAIIVILIKLYSVFF